MWLKEVSETIQSNAGGSEKLRNQENRKTGKQETVRNNWYAVDKVKFTKYL